jgi:hypothetical protein
MRTSSLHVRFSGVRFSGVRFSGVRSCLLLAGTLMLGGCLEGRLFTERDAIRIVELGEGDYVEAPFDVVWETDLTDVASWAVFLDRPPIEPNASIEDLETQERENLFLTTEQILPIEFVTPKRTSVADRKDRHRIIVVALNDKQERIGDHAGSVELTVLPQ